MESRSKSGRFVMYGLAVAGLVCLALVLAPAIEKARRPSSRYEVTFVNPNAHPVSVTVVLSEGELRRFRVPPRDERREIVFEGHSRDMLKDVSFWVVGFGSDSFATAAFLNGADFTDTTRVVLIEGTGMIERTGERWFSDGGRVLGPEPLSEPAVAPANTAEREEN